MQSECLNCSLDVPADSVFCLNCYMPHGWSPDTDRRELAVQLTSHPLVKGYLSGAEQHRNDLRELLQHLSAKRVGDTQQAAWLFMSIFDYLCGYGPLGPILRDPSLRLILVKDFDRILVSSTHRDVRAGARYDSREHLIDELKRLASMHNIQLDGPKSECEFVNSNWNFKIALQPEPNGNFLIVSAS